MKQDKSNKIRLLKIWEILKQESDEDNYISSKDIMEKLGEMGIECDRRTLYDDIDVLNDFGYEVLVEKQPGKANMYYVVDRTFDVPELRILMDAVQAASFVTPKKTKLFLEKIADLGGSSRAEILKKNIVNFDTSKHSNEEIFYSVDEIERGILSGKKVSFLYFEYNTKKEKVYRKNKKRYVVNPCATIFSNDNYYLVAYNEKYDSINAYRIDRMDKVRVEEEKKINPPKDKFDLKRHKVEVFDMFTGETKRVRIWFDKQVIDPVMDKFGETIRIAEIDENTAEIMVDVQISERFLAWVCSFAEKMWIKGPEEIVVQVKEYIKKMYSNYSTDDFR